MTLKVDCHRVGAVTKKPDVLSPKKGSASLETVGVSRDRVLRLDFRG